MNFTLQSPEMIRVIDCTPGKLIPVNLACASGKIVQTALRCGTTNDGSDYISLLESNPCMARGAHVKITATMLISLCVAGTVFIIGRFFILHRERLRREAAMQDEVEYEWDERPVSDAGLVEEEMKEAEAHRWGVGGKRVNLTPSESESGSDLSDESDAESSTGSSGSSGSWTPSRCGMELGRGLGSTSR